MTTKELVDLCNQQMFCLDCQFDNKCREYESEYGVTPMHMDEKAHRRTHSIPDDAYSEGVLI